MTPVCGAAARSASRMPASYGLRARVSWRMVSVSADAAEDHLLLGDDAVHPQAVDRDARHLLPARALVDVRRVDRTEIGTRRRR